MGLIRASWISVAGHGASLPLVDVSNRTRQRRFAVYLMFALCIFCAVSIAVFELGMLRAEAPERWTQLLRWAHLPFALLMISLLLGTSLVMAYLIRGDALHAAANHRAANERLVSLVESMPSAVLLVDDRRVIRFVNQRAGAMFRYNHSQLIRMRIESLMPARSGTAFGDLLEKFARDVTGDAAIAGIEYSVFRSDGSEIMVQLDASAVVIDSERLVVVSIVDISERKRSEREAALQRDELARLSRAASLSALSSSLAHELVQPLTAILSNAQAGARLLANQPPDLEGVRDSLGHVVDNAKRASDVIRKLRSLLRKDEAEFTRLDINDVVRDVQLIVRSDLIERHVDVVLDLRDDLPQITGDRVQLQQVLMNLMMNAADAMGSDARARRLTIRTIAAAPGAIEVQVEDTGTGIPEADLERIFAPFVTTKKGGMGLGLSVCMMLIKAHAGSLWATNNSAGGATLHFRLPRSTDLANLSPSPPSKLTETG